jgi:hypothetical protein
MGAVKEDSGEVPCNCSYGTVAYQGGFYAAGAVDPAEGRRIAAQGENTFFGAGVQVKAFKPCGHGSANELKKVIESAIATERGAVWDHNAPASASQAVSGDSPRAAVGHAKSGELPDGYAVHR